MRGIVKERAAAASWTEKGPVTPRYKEVRSRLFLSEMPFGATVVVVNSYSFHSVEDTAFTINSKGLRGNGASAFLIAVGEMISASFAAWQGEGTGSLPEKDQNRRRFVDKEGLNVHHLFAFAKSPAQ